MLKRKICITQVAQIEWHGDQTVSLPNGIIIPEINTGSQRATVATHIMETPGNTVVRILDAPGSIGEST